MAMMKLDPPETREIDYSQTKKNVAKWFDTEYSKYKRLANLPLLPNNALSLTPSRGTAHANSVEDRTVTRANAKQVLEFIDAVLDMLDDRYKTVIKSRYIQRLQVWSVCDILGVERSQVSVYDRQGCAEFAQTLDMSAGTQLTAYKSEA
ncbi:ArpU family phage packaging/lysis transcriptional regulator [Lactobacillus sp. AN1001]